MPAVMRELLDLAREREWVYKDVRCGGGCCSRYEYVCSKCRGRDQAHEKNCEAARVISEADAWLAANELHEGEAA
jgi:hypothetical protein